MNAESESVELALQPVPETNGEFLLDEPGLKNPDLREAFLPPFREAAAVLRFTVGSEDRLQVRPPVERRWNGSKLEELELAAAGDVVRFTWSGDGEWNALWLNHDGHQVASAASRQGADFTDRVVVAPGDAARIEIVDPALSYVGMPSPALRVSGRAHFVACPPPAGSLLVRAGDSDPVPVELAADEQFLGLVPVPSGDPETVALVVAIAGSPEVHSAPHVLRVPTTLEEAEISTDGSQFSRQLYASDVPKTLRFRHSGYAPGRLALVLGLTGGEGEQMPVNAVKTRGTATHADYELEINPDKALLMRGCIPGELTIDVRTDAAGGVSRVSSIQLLPRSLRGVWQAIDSAEVVLRPTSQEIERRTIVALGSHFDSRPAPDVEPQEESDTLQAPSDVATNVVLVGGQAIPLDDRDFVPVFPRDATELWKRSITLVTDTDEPLLRFGDDEREREARRWWDLLVGTRANGEAEVLPLRPGWQALLALPTGRHFTGRIVDPHAMIDSGQDFGVFFRGFCWLARLEKLRKSRDTEGLLLLLANPVPADRRCERRVSAFLPCRVLRSTQRQALAFWEPPAEPVTVPIEEDVPVHERLGYVYRSSGGGRFWSHLPDVDAALEYVTFDGLLFALDIGSVDFVGWWLPENRGEFAASPPFHEYTFDFREGMVSPYEFEVQGGEVRCTRSACWLVDEERGDLEARIRTSTVRHAKDTVNIGKQRVEVRWRQRDSDGTLLATASKVIGSFETGLYALS